MLVIKMSRKYKPIHHPLLKGCKSDAECATECNKFFVQKVEKLVHGVHTSSATGKTMASARDFIKNIAKETSSFELHCVGIATTKKAIRSMGSTKAIGVDGLPCSFWKAYCNDLAPFVNLMVNTSIKTGTYPKLFKDAIVVPVFKGGRKDSSQFCLLCRRSWRPSSSTSFLTTWTRTISCHRPSTDSGEGTRQLQHSSRPFTSGRVKKGPQLPHLTTVPLLIPSARIRFCSD